MSAASVRSRLDSLLVARGLADSLPKAQAMILAGEVTVNGQRADKAGTAIAGDAQVEVHSRSLKYASRGGIKLEGALEEFGIAVTGMVCLDVGSSTGGFTDCLLQNGASKVFAVDVNVAQLAWKLHEDGRVVRVERNARELIEQDLGGERPEFVVADVSFISVGKILPAAVGVSSAAAEFLVLIKPQFELRREEIGEGGIVSASALHEKAISIVRSAAEAAGLRCLGVKPSRLTGAEGNQEYFLHARKAVE